MENHLFVKTVVVILAVHSVLARRFPQNQTVKYHNEHGIGGEITSTESQLLPQIETAEVCHYSDPKVEECIIRNAEKAKHLLALGVPSLGIQPLEPLRIPSIRLRQHNVAKNRFKYDAWLSDMTLSGLSNFSFNKLDLYPKEMKLSGNISLPRLDLAGEYVILGEFQMLPVESTGKLSAILSECSAALDAQGARVHKRMVLRDVNVKLRCAGRPQASVDQPHSTTSEMEMVTDHLVMMHSEELAKEMQPAVETSLAMVLEDVANKFLKHVPVDMVFPA